MVLKAGPDAAVITTKAEQVIKSPNDKQLKQNTRAKWDLENVA